MDAAFVANSRLPSSSANIRNMKTPVEVNPNWSVDPLI